MKRYIKFIIIFGLVLFLSAAAEADENSGAPEATDKTTEDSQEISKPSELEVKTIYKRKTQNSIGFSFVYSDPAGRYYDYVNDDFGYGIDLNFYFYNNFSARLIFTKSGISYDGPGIVVIDNGTAYISSLDKYNNYQYVAGIQYNSDMTRHSSLIDDWFLYIGMGRQTEKYSTYNDIIEGDYIYIREIDNSLTFTLFQFGTGVQKHLTKSIGLGLSYNYTIIDNNLKTDAAISDIKLSLLYLYDRF